MTREPIWTPDFLRAFSAHFMFSLGFWMFVHLPGYLQTLGGREREIGLVVGSLSVSAILVRPFVGRFMDTRGRRPMIILGALVNLVAVAAYLSVDSLGPWIYVIRLVHGIGEAAVFSVMFTVAADLVPASRRAEGIALFGVSGLLPLSLGGLLGDWILAYWDYDVLFAVSLLFAFLACVLCLSIAESRPEHDGEHEHSSLLSVFTAPALLPLWILTLGFTLGITSYFTFIKTFIQQIQIGSVGLFFLAYSIASVGLRLLFSWVPERIGLIRALVPALLSLCAGIWILSSPESARTIALAGTLCGLGHAYVFPIISALVVSRARTQNRGMAMTLFTSLFDFGAVSGAPLLGWVVQSSDYQTMFRIAACIVLCFSIGFFFVDYQHRNAR